MTFLTSSLFLVSVLTSLTVEGIKKLLDNTNVKYSSNVLAVIISMILALVVSGAYLIICDVALTAKIGVEIMCLMYLSFLVSTVGYDKVVQMLSQIKFIKK